MAFTTDFSQVQEYSEFKAQPYEMIVVDAYEGVNDYNGKKRIVIDYVVRNDVQQEKQNAHLWDEQYPSRETGKYHNGILMGKIKALGIQEGKSYESLDAMLKDLIGKTAKVTVKLDEYNGKVRPKVRFTNPTEFPNVQHEWKNKPEIAATQIEEDDLPF